MNSGFDRPDDQAKADKDPIARGKVQLVEANFLDDEDECSLAAVLARLATQGVTGASEQSLSGKQQSRCHLT